MNTGSHDSPYPVLLKNLKEVQEWISRTEPLVETLKTHNEFMSKVVECMNMALYLLRVGLSLTPNEATSQRGYSKYRAIALGHVVRIAKLYQALEESVVADRGELCAIFGRLLIETATRLEYLMGAKRNSYRHFVLVGYRPEKEQLVDLQTKAKSRPLLPIEKRMLNSIKTRLRRDGITIKQLLANKQWDLDGKSFRQLLGKDNEWRYAYGFGGPSHFVHGDWRDLSYFHLIRKGRFYQPKWKFSRTDPRYACPITKMCLGTLHQYIRWSHSDPDNFVRPIVARLIAVTRSIDEAHERQLNV
jgi:hypothetical protein